MAKRQPIGNTPPERLKAPASAAPAFFTWKLLAVVCVLVIGAYAYMTRSGAWESVERSAADETYNLLVQGFRAGQLSLKKEVPPGLAQLADPYDPTANAIYRPAPYRMLDLSYYKGRLYLYFGVTPALMLFWPFVALTGKYLFHNWAVTIFCITGFLASVGLLRALWQRHFPEASVWVVMTGAIGLGLATGLPIILARSQIYEVPVSCGYMLMMLTLGALWCACHQPERSGRWLTAASVAYGLAVGARPSLLFGAAILLMPVFQAWSERRRVWTLLMAAIIPITLIGLGLMLYNIHRFDSPFEFGVNYQLAPIRPHQYFSPRYLWFNFRVYFLEPARWSRHFPFVRDIATPPLPPGYGSLQTPFGALTNIPLVWLALAVPLAWRNQSGRAASILRWFMMTVVMLFGICALTIGSFFASSFRYEVDFLPTLVLLAVVGILGLEHALVDRPIWRRAVSWVWGVVVAFSVAFNLLASVEYYAEGHYEVGTTLLHLGRVQEAIDQYKWALRIKPDYGEPHENLGIALVQQGKVDEGIGHYEQALRLNPNYAEGHYNLGNALLQVGRLPEANRHFEEAVRLKPDFSDAHNSLGLMFIRLGRVPEAIGHFEEALRLKPNYAEAHYNLGVALMGQGKQREAMEHWVQALQIDPDYAEAHSNLGIVLQRQGKLPDAVAQYEQAVRIKPDYAGAHFNLGVALEKMGRIPEAIAQYERALRIKPDFTQAQAALTRLRALPQER